MAARPLESARPESPRLTLDQVLDRLAADSDRHMTTGPASEPELRACEIALGVRMPEGLRAFLARLGSGIFYDRHELFGPSSLQIHDIELLPSLPSFWARYREEHAPGCVPFHRVGERLHAFEQKGPKQGARIVELTEGKSYMDMESFLVGVVL